MHPTSYGRSAGEGHDAAAFGEKARAAEELVQRYRSEPAALVTLLVELSKSLGGLPRAALAYVALKLRLPEDSIVALAEAHRLAPDPAGMPRLGLCINGPCAARGGWEVERILREKGIDYEELGCQGACDLGPIACYHRGAPLAISAARARSLAKADPRDWEDLLSVEKPVHAFKTEPRVAFANIFAKGSHQLATARRHGVYAGVEAALGKSPEALLETVAQSGLRGSGGMAQAAAEKWRAVRAAPGEAKYLVINGMESEPGTFKDRVLLERDPHLVVAGAILAAWGVGAHEAFLCIRAEYELAIERARAAVEEATRAGLIGARVLDHDYALRIHVRLLPGRYLTGEQTALLESLEGRAPRPRVDGKPEEAGLFGAPTLVHNVETLAKLPCIAQNGGEWYRGLGLDGAAGTLIACIAGDLARPGNYEVRLGTPIRELVEGLGGGLAQGKVLTAVQVGGAWAAYLRPDQLDTRLDELALAPLGAGLGSGSVIAISDKSCLVDIARRDTRYLAREGCGRCAACKDGLPVLAAELERIVEPGARERIEAVIQQMRAGEACALGRRATNPAESLLRDFEPAIAEHTSGHCACSPRKKARVS